MGIIEGLRKLSPQFQAALLTEVQRKLAENKLADYRPYTKQREFHRLGKTKRERLLRAGNQCISPWTFVETECGAAQIGAALGEPNANVQSLVGEIQQNIRIDGWFLRCIEPAFRVVLDNGEFFDCSGKHQVLICEGWISLDQLMLSANGLRCWHKLADYQASCVEDGYLDGLLPHLEAGIVQEPFYKQDGVRGHNLLWQLTDAEEQTPEHIRACLASDHLTIVDDGERSFAALFEKFSAANVSRPVLRLKESIQALLLRRAEFYAHLQSGDEEGLCREFFLHLDGQQKPPGAEDTPERSRLIHQVVEPFLCAQFLGNSTQAALVDVDRAAIFYPLSHPDLVGGRRIIAILPIGYQPLLDCEVPDSHNYKAAGVYHHNCGKTYSVGCESAYHLTGLYPSDWEGRKWDRPIVMWASSETGESTRDNPQRALLGLPGDDGTGSIPKKHLGLSQGQYGMASGIADLYDYIRVRHHTNGVVDGWSLLRFKYYAQGRRKWQGPPVDFVWFDEEPPEDIYDEGLARTIATGGMAALSFTPLMGMSEVVRRYLVDPTPDRSDTNMTIEDAEHISPEERERIILSFKPHERDARAKGIPILGSGRIFPVADEQVAEPSIEIPKHWPRLAGMDFGWDHPTAAVWGAWDRDTDTVHIYDAYRVREQPIAIHAAAFVARRAWIPMVWPHDGLQHDKGSGIEMSKQYRNHGVNMLHEMAQYPDTTDDDTKTSVVSVEAGIADMLDRMLTGRLKVAAHLTDWFDEFRLYHRKDGKIIKEYDDLISATRYLIMMLRYAITEPVEEKVVPRKYNWRAGC